MELLDWNLPEGVFAAVTTVSQPGNLAVHVGDDPAAVIRNRRQLQNQFDLPVSPRWLRQVHSTRVVDFDDAYPTAEADAIYANQSQTVCAVLTADCLPILLCSDDGSEIAAVHAGWRGLAGGIIDNALMRFDCPAHQLSAYIGPAISMPVFEVGDEVRAAFLSTGAVDSETFRSHIAGKWHANLPLLAQRILEQHGCQAVKQSGHCTYTDSRWYSYRRDSSCGRIASVIWKK
ncbi:peptidoglycan editing factor PgeF [Pseudidiomarina marina]|uniref:Purine nucleoside phosphorylase n=1 Tax=Pseudidiomarina marina TaxID=502366 RepID=A0A432YCU8_9GAMM|nr:peptidoglycan editing factor PgeF [Pseudidiomarina marina]PHR63285.1 MAG: hypothetical protein COA51_11200 [Idiomarina sp.]RUO58686.1 peptidoglycan editing factor PgeF [Pseudidiomarina marina]